MREIEMLRDALGVVDVVDGAAAVLRRACGLQGGEAALIPQLHGEADDGPALFLHKRGDYGAVDTSAHGYGDDLGGSVSGAICGFGLECDGHFFFAVDIVLENLSSSVLVAGEIWVSEGMDAEETIPDFNSAPLTLGKTAPLKSVRVRHPSVMFHSRNVL
jgi:hypothetical protein